MTVRNRRTRGGGGMMNGGNPSRSQNRTVGVMTGDSNPIR